MVERRNKKKEEGDMKSYTRTFKDEAMRLVGELGAKETSKRLGIPYYTVKDWCKLKKKHGEGWNGGERIKKPETIEQEIERLRFDNKILKDALDFFTQSQEKQVNKSLTNTQSKLKKSQQVG
jgi:transposase-like protein